MARVKVQTPRCSECHRTSVVELPLLGYEAWAAGAFVQDAFPGMPREEREMLITGTHPACWDAIFADLEDELPEQPAASPW